jgi:excisionase family DNA binding protein
MAVTSRSSPDLVTDGSRKLMPATTLDPVKDRQWTPEEVSVFLGVPVPTLYQWRHKGIGPKSRRVGRHLRYKPEDVQAWFEEQA